MGKVRIYELAKKLNLENKDLIAELNAKGIAVRTHSNSVDEIESLKLLGFVNNNKSDKNILPKTILRKRKKDSNVTISNTNNVADAKDSINHCDTSKKTTQTLKINNNINKNKSFTNVEQKKISSLNDKIDYVKKNNVVRMIDAKDIKARLAREGRVFNNNIKKYNIINKNISSHESTLQKHVKSINASSENKTSWKSFKKQSFFDYKKKKNKEDGEYELWLSNTNKYSKKKDKLNDFVVAKTSAHKRIIELMGPVTVSDLARKMSIKASELVVKLMNMGMMVTINQLIDIDTASILAAEFNYEIKDTNFIEKNFFHSKNDDDKNLIARAPIVTVMGHVDHGKTSILDVIRSTNIVSKEIGGITQHIGAYSVKTKHGNVTFLDTPGHAAFTLMRSRGAKITDIVVLVIAANDGVKPQTIEAINHAQAANVPIVVAINKIDLPNININVILKQLTSHNVISEDLGGDVQIFKVSALNKIGIKEFVEGIAVLAEIRELKANPSSMPEGFVIEARLDRGRGPVATLLVKSGTLKLGEHLIAGQYSGRIRAIYDSNFKQIKTAGPSMPVQVLGLSGIPDAGDTFNVVKSEKDARIIVLHRSRKKRELELSKIVKMSMTNFLDKSSRKDKIELKLIIKADVFGSIEAFSSTLPALSTELICINIIHIAVGTITENDVNLAIASKAIIIGFNVKPDAKANNLAINGKVEIRNYKIIYEALTDIKKAMLGLLKPNIKEKYLGKAEIRMVIIINKEKVAGSYVLNGIINRSAKIRVMRNGKKIHTGYISSLKRFKDNVKEVLSGYECGIGLKNFNDISKGDILECFELEDKVTSNVDTT